MSKQESTENLIRKTLQNEAGAIVRQDSIDRLAGILAEALSQEPPEPGLNFTNYLLAQERTRVARAKWEEAGTKRDQAMIHERLAEVTSQHDPINTLLESEDLEPRQRMVLLARYVATGRKGY